MGESAAIVSQIYLRDQVETKETFSSEYKSKAWNDKSKEKSCLEKTKGKYAVSLEVVIPCEKDIFSILVF